MILRGSILALSLLVSSAVLASELTCGCCSKWVKHLKQNGFDVIAKDVRDVVPYKIRGGVTPELASCHTAFVDGYVIEGHVPASDIKRLLQERPAAKGLAVPGMPSGSPGMEQGNRKDHYEVKLIKNEGGTSTYARH